MKKIFFLIAVVVLTVGFNNFRSISIPVAFGKKARDISIESNASVLPGIKVMTYNIHRGINKDKKLNLEGIVEVIESSEAEIIALQEVERFSIRTGFKDQIRYIAEKLSMHYAFGKSISILNGQYGNAVLSRYPIEEYELYELPSEGERRTLLRTMLNVYGNKLVFYSTHLGLNQKERDKQVEKIITIIGDEEKFILAGDFNTKAEDLGAITGIYKDCASLEEKYSKATFEKEGLVERIDYIFASENFLIKSYYVLETDASDHYPVISIFELIN